MNKKKKKKLDKEVALARIKILMDNFYEHLGRNYDDDEMIIKDRERDLIEDIDEIMNKVDIDKKILIIERFKFDKTKK